MAAMSVECWFNDRRAEDIERCHGWLEWRKALKTGIPGWKWRETKPQGSGRSKPLRTRETSRADGVGEANRRADYPG